MAQGRVPLCRMHVGAALVPLLLIAAAPGPTPADYAADARALPQLIADNYAYLDDLPGGKVPASPQLDAERDAVHDADSLLRYAGDMIAALADHHALTARSFKDDWAIVPSRGTAPIRAAARVHRSFWAIIIRIVPSASSTTRLGTRGSAAG